MRRYSGLQHARVCGTAQHSAPPEEAFAAPGPVLHFCCLPCRCSEAEWLSKDSPGTGQGGHSAALLPNSTSPRALTFGALLLAGPADVLELCSLWHGLRSCSKLYPFGHISFSCLQKYSLQKLCSVHLFFTKKVVYS